jgi:hypothetical protein
MWHCWCEWDVKSLIVVNNSTYWHVTVFFILMNVTAVNKEIIFDVYASKVTIQMDIQVDCSFGLSNEHLHKREQLESFLQ